jgi:hypothetical protein
VIKLRNIFSKFSFYIYICAPLNCVHMLTNVLLNFFKMFREELETAGVPNNEKTIRTGF